MGLLWPVEFPSQKATPAFFVAELKKSGRYPNFVATYGRGYPGFAPSYGYQFPASILSCPKGALRTASLLHVAAQVATGLSKQDTRHHKLRSQHRARHGLHLL
ncbi:hypothetical protein J1605_009074 [Eschrichtius robustus]|uniref:Uncharacterized protein n=1 Tax=Eschrichtius robustus TaxID=9764 RepID=A0AB34GU77_ESCRO|nr:hypothetical protein J1605_009074 [Eschrichtius robustus]